MKSIIKFEEIEKKIIDIRLQKVIFDFDVAELYAVETREINQAVKNNPEKFPEGYVFTLSKEEKQEVIKNFDNHAKIKFFPQPPKAFTEKGLYMLATILKGEKATQTTIAIIEAFARLRNLSRNIKELSVIKDERKKKDIMRKSGDIVTEIFGDDLNLNETETTIELNFAVLKFKHTVKRK
jgi:phage regulator Rha-like protein